MKWFFLSLSAIIEILVFANLAWPTKRNTAMIIAMIFLCTFAILNKLEEIETKINKP
jgi:hypothetical protein